MLVHRVQDRDQLAHAGSKRYPFGLTRFKEALVESPDYGIESGSYQRSHVEGSPYRTAPAPDGAPATQGAAVSIEWRHSHRSRDLTTVQPAQFRHLGHQSERQHRPQPRGAAQDPLFDSPGRGGTNQLPQLFTRPFQMLFQPPYVLLELRLDPWGGRMQPVLLGSEHPHQLAPSDYQGLQLLRSGHQPGVGVGA